MTFDLHDAMWTVIVLFALSAVFSIGSAIADRRARRSKRREIKWWQR